MFISSKKFLTQLVKGMEGVTALSFEQGIKADKEVKRDLEAVRDTLWDIRTTLREIRKLLEWAAQQPNDTLDKWGAAVIADDILRDRPDPKEDWISGEEVKKMVGWKVCNARMLMNAGITFRQAKKGANLSVYRPSVQSYIQRRAEKKNRTK